MYRTVLWNFCVILHYKTVDICVFMIRCTYCCLNDTLTDPWIILCMYVCMCLNMCVCVYICMYVSECMCVYVCVCMYVRVCTYVCMYVYMYLCMYPCVNVYVRMYVCMYVCMNVCMCVYVYMYVCMYTGCPKRNVPDFGRVSLMPKYTDITQNTYVQSGTVTEIMAREFWNFDSCYSLIDYQIHIETGRNM